MYIDERILGNTCSANRYMNIVSLIMWLWLWWEGQKLNSSEYILKELDVNEICCMEQAQTTIGCWGFNHVYFA